MKYFDFHAHILLKQLFSESINIDATTGSGDIGAIPRACSDLSNIISSQIHQSQLANFGDEVIVGVVLYGMESRLAEEVNGLRNLLKPASQHKLSAGLLTQIVGNSVTACSDFTISRTLDNYLNAPHSFNMLDKTNVSGQLPKNKVNVFFVIEGCHSLIDSSNGMDINSHPYSAAEALSNLKRITDKVPVIAVNPTHMQQSNFCNHACSIQLTNPDYFIPRGIGISSEGHALIQGLFDSGICVDTKHMSYKSRLDLYDSIENGNYSNVQPIVCTHAGFTGVPFSTWPGFIKRKKLVKNAVYLEIAKTMQISNEPPQPGAPSFNLSSINLFDEEIVWIVQHGGVIGLSMDRRILGYVGLHDTDPTGSDSQEIFIVDKEYISKEEWQSFGIANNAIGTLVDADDCMTKDQLIESAQGPISARNEFFFDHVLLQLKHYLQVCVDGGISLETASKQIVIGSDFDGLINPFINACTVVEMQELKAYIRMNFGYFLETLKDSKEWYRQLDVKGFAEDLFYNNGLRFLKSRLG